MFDLLRSNTIDFIEVFGHSGIGKTTICEYIGNYCMERGMFSNGIATINF